MAVRGSWADRRMMAISRRRAPISRRKLPISRRRVRIGRRKRPISWRRAPISRRRRPISWRTAPTCRRKLPISWRGTGDQSEEAAYQSEEGTDQRRRCPRSVGSLPDLLGSEWSILARSGYATAARRRMRRGSRTSRQKVRPCVEPLSQNAPPCGPTQMPPPARLGCRGRSPPSGTTPASHRKCRHAVFSRPHPRTASRVLLRAKKEDPSRARAGAPPPHHPTTAASPSAGPDHPRRSAAARPLRIPRATHRAPEFLGIHRPTPWRSPHPRLALPPRIFANAHC